MENTGVSILRCFLCCAPSVERRPGPRKTPLAGRRGWESRLALLVTPLEVDVGATHFNLPPFLDQFSWSLIAMLYIALGSNVCSQVACGGRLSAAG